MAKTVPIAAPEPTAAPAAPPYPRLGESVTVVVGEGLRLRNNETGGFFEPLTPTPQTVTVTLLRRLTDGDLVLV